MKKYLIHGILPALLMLLIVNSGMESTQQVNEEVRPILERENFELQWEDHFDTFRLENWTIGLKDEATGDLVPGAAGQYLLNDRYDAYYTRENVYIEDGTLVLRNQKGPVEGLHPEGTFPYSSGWVMSMHKVYFNEGYLEVRARFPGGDKVWPAIWLIPEDLTWCPEWDLFEYFGYRKGLGYDQMGMHLCYSRSPQQQWSDFFITGFDEKYGCNEWHTYGFAWTTAYAKWFIDGREVRHLDAAGIKDWPAKDMYIVLNNGTRTESPDEHTEWPNELRIDYLKLFTKRGSVPDR